MTSRTGPCLRSHTLVLGALLFLSPGLMAQGSSPGEWPAYGRDPGGSRFSALTQITRESVSRLTVAWTWRSGGSSAGGPSLQATPVVVDGTMYVGTPQGHVVALDPATGTERWRYDPGVDPRGGYGDYANRGVTVWRDSRAAAGAACARRVFMATIDARLLALDAATGRPCAGFGANGTVDLRAGLRLPPFEPPAYQMTSPPVAIGDLIVTGSSIADNSRRAPASGEVRAWDARTGALRWTWDPIPQRANDPAAPTWRDGSAATTGGANAWSVLMADPARDLVFVPTSSPAPDYVGIDRLGDNRYANSIVALRASTGAVVWHFQTVHHDLWDYDNASPPTLTTVRQNGRDVPAVLQATKTGQLFILHRETGVPLFGVEERAVPISRIPGEVASPTQPFTTVTPPLSPHRISPDDAWGPTPADRTACRALIAGLRNEGIFTPPDTAGTLVMPSNIGGAHWGGVAADATRGIALVPVNRFASMVQLIPREGFDIVEAWRENSRLNLGYEYNRMSDTPYMMRRRFLLGPSGLPCTPPPFGALVAVSLRTGEKLWDVPLGTFPSPPGQPALPADWGSANLGGPIVTASGLVFIAATLDRKIRAFDVETGRLLWEAQLPAGGRATPATYEVNGRQYVVIAAGGGGLFGEGDAIVAFALGGER